MAQGAFFFALKPDSAILGDINGALMEVYSTVHKHPRLVSRAVHRIKRTPEQYYMLRDEGPGLLPPIQRVARFIFLNRNCFNGIYRTNKEGKFNVPFGSRTGQLPGESFFYRCSGGIGVKS
ncbi:MAG: DNA adenine methylase [Deltaproteobacteria bacterium]|nr:DNA adenine methylase [Deltaproteobacteria bacterium]